MAAQFAPRAALLAGVRSELSIAISVIPFGLIYGVLGLSAGLSAWQTQAMSAIVFAGSAQFIGARLMAAGTPLSVLWLTTFVVNMRHVLYSTSLGRDLRHLSAGWRWLLAYLLTDEAYAVTAVHYANTHTPLIHKHWYFLGAGLTLWVVWQSSTAVGVLLGAQIPASWALDFTLALTFIAIVVPALNGRPAIGSALTAGVVAVLTAGLPYKLGLISAALAGIFTGVALERTLPPRGDL